jgi:subtilisin family serine protease
MPPNPGTIIHPGKDFLVVLNDDVITPKDVGKQIASQTLVVSPQDLVGLSPLSAQQFENVGIAFNLDLPGGLAVVENDDNWGVGPLGYNAQRFWQVGVRGSGVRIGIADSGIDVTHSTFATLRSNQRLTAFAAFANDGTKVVQHRPDGSLIPDSAAIPTLSHWHGTFCSAILVGEPTGGKARGMAPKAELAVVQVLQEANNGSVASIFAGLSWLADQRCDIISLSLGWEGKHDQWANPIRTLLRQGAVVVAAAGNSFGVPGVPPSDSPANYPLDPDDANQGLFISVGAIDQGNLVADFSGGETVNWSGVQDTWPNGTQTPSPFATAPPRIVPSMVAPGVGIVSASPVSPAGQYRMESGTSMATPHVAGLLALILSALRARTSATPRNAADLFFKSLAPLPGTVVDRSGRGKIDLDRLFSNIDSFGH